jgi:hypothetical protein
MIKLVHRLLSTLWGMLAGAIFKRLWKLAARKDEAPRSPMRIGNGGRS